MGSTLTLMAGGAGWARDGTTRRASIELATGQSFDLSPLIFGQFIEFLGRGIEGGVFEPGSPLSDADGFRRDVLEKVGGLNAPILRFPGGTYTKIYHWRDGVGPAAQRPLPTQSDLEGQCHQPLRHRGVRPLLPASGRGTVPHREHGSRHRRGSGQLGGILQRRGRDVLRG
jgi:hypothetical protein